MRNLKNAFLIMIVVAVFGGLYWYQTTPPKFKGLDAAIKRVIWSFNHTSDESEKARRAIFEDPFFDYETAIREARAGKRDLSKDEIQSLEIMFALRTRVIQKVESLQKALTVADIRNITQDNPLSIYLLYNMSTATPFAQPNCTEADVEKLAHHVGTDVMLKQDKDLVSYAWAREITFSKSRTERLRSLIRTDARFADFRDLDFLYFQHASYESPATKAFLGGLGGDLQTGLNEKRQRLVAAGRTGSNLDMETYQLAEVAPACFVNITGFFKSEALWRTKTVGQEVLRKTKEYFKSHPNIPKDSEVVMGNILPMLKRDGWHRPFRYRSAGGVLTVFSAGRDQNKPGDEVVIGTIPLPASNRALRTDE